MLLHTLLTDVLPQLAQLVPAEITPPNITPDLDAAPAKNAMKLVAQLFGVGVVGLVLAGGIVGLIVAFGKLSPNARSHAMVALLCLIAGVLLFSSVTGLIAFFGKINLFA